MSIYYSENREKNNYFIRETGIRWVNDKKLPKLIFNFNFSKCRKIINTNANRSSISKTNLLSLTAAYKHAKSTHDNLTSHSLMVCFCCCLLFQQALRCQITENVKRKRQNVTENILCIKTITAKGKHKAITQLLSSFAHIFAPLFV